MGFVVRHVQLRGMSGVRDVLNTVTSVLPSPPPSPTFKPPAYPVVASLPSLRHPSLPVLHPPAAPNNPFRKNQTRAPAKPGAPTWDGWWGGKTGDVKAFKNAVAVAGETGLPNGSACAMILDNFILGDLSLGTNLYDALVASTAAAASQYKPPTNRVTGIVAEAINKLLSGDIVMAASGPVSPTTAPPDPSWADNSVPGGTPGETTALPTPPLSTPAPSFIPGVPNVVLAGSALVIGAALLMRKRR